MLNFSRYSVLTFDCYGTLIDWETGILHALKPLLLSYDVALSDEQILETFASLEANAEADGYRRYREVLRQVVQGFGTRFGFRPADYELNGLASSIGQWRPFSDTAEALQALSRKYRIAVISNIDADLFAVTAQHLPVEFDWVITAEQARAYKPTRAVFEYALRKIDVPQDQLLHVAQSLYHDIAPASALRITTVWVNRRAGSTGSGATLPAGATPDLEVPDLRTLIALTGTQSIGVEKASTSRRPAHAT
jgi:2-haloacid dehalogenase